MDERYEKVEEELNDMIKNNRPCVYLPRDTRQIIAGMNPTGLDSDFVWTGNTIISSFRARIKELDKGESHYVWNSERVWLSRFVKKWGLCRWTKSAAAKFTCLGVHRIRDRICGTYRDFYEIVGQLRKKHNHIITNKNKI